MKRVINRYITTPQLLSMLIGILWISAAAGMITSNNNNDPQPWFTAHYPYSFVVFEHKNYLHGINQTPRDTRFNFSAMPIYQRANYGTDAAGNKAVPVGDIPARINMLAILPYNTFNGSMTCSTANYSNLTDATGAQTGNLPCGYTFPQTYETVRNQLLSDICTIISTGGGSVTSAPEFTTVQGLLEVQQSNTLYQQTIGIFSNKMKYRKFGVRFNFEALLAYGFGVMLNTGFASITQTPALTDSTRNAAAVTYYRSTIVSTTEWQEILGAISVDLMGQTQNLARAVGLEINTFDETSWEDLHVDLFWRGVIPVQWNPQIIPGLGYQRWEQYLVIPFCSIGGTLALAKSKDPNVLFSLPFGNNGSNAVRARAGICIDFINTIEFSGELGVTHFGDKNATIRIPSDQYQRIFYPFTAPVKLSPGNNWHAALGLYAYNFDSVVSASVIYSFVHHEEDRYTLLNGPTSTTNCNPTGFDLPLLSSLSSWRVHYINGTLVGLISPHARLQGFIQIPVAQRNAYRSTTFGISFEAGF